MAVVRIRNPYYADIAEQKQLQVEDHDHSARCAPVEVVSSAAPDDRAGSLCQNFVYDTKVQSILSAFGPNLEGRTVVAVCAGIGDYGIRELVERGAQVTLTDLSPQAVERAKERWRNFPTMRFRVADCEALPFADDSFDVAFCHAGLHHLPRPVLGIFEMYRVARSRVIFVEAQDSWALRLMVKLGLSKEWEPSGNYVYRFTRRELHKMCASLGANSYEVRTFFNQYSGFLNRHVYPYLNNSLGLAGFKVLYAAFNRVLQSQGNVFVAAIDKNG